MTFSIFIIGIITLGAVFLVIVDKIRPPVQPNPEVLVSQRILESQFGSEIIITHGKISAPLEADRWFVKLREKHLHSTGENDLGDWLSDYIIRTQDNIYLHVLIHPGLYGWKSENISTQKPVITQINELRARRALFNHKEAYQKAFGETPNKEHIQRLQQLQEKRNVYDPESAGTEMMGDAPVGAEIYAQKS
jgi:hypothetical protein